LDIYEIKKRTLDFVEHMREKKAYYGRYYYSYGSKKPVLYASTYAVLIRGLYGDSEKLTDHERAEWITYLQYHQSDDGLFRDPVVANELAEKEDWWGWRHLTIHVLMAMTALKTITQKELTYINRFFNKAYFQSYLESLDWGDRVAWTSNELQNLGVMLQYSRDFHGNKEADLTLQFLFEFLDKKQDKKTGLYGHTFYEPLDLSHGVQAGYHFWLLYFYDKRDINYKDRIIDSILQTQNIMGGYGVQLNSSACEDIDSIDSLVRFSMLTDYRVEDIKISLLKAFSFVLSNLNIDGGWVFRRHESFEYGHKEMFSGINESSMFATWFRSLGFAYLLTGLENLEHDTGKFYYPWKFCRCPGLQFLH
jgi:hypothetical protein